MLWLQTATRTCLTWMAVGLLACTSCGTKKKPTEKRDRTVCRKGMEQLLRCRDRWCVGRTKVGVCGDPAPLKRSAEKTIRRCNKTDVAMFRRLLAEDDDCKGAFGYFEAMQKRFEQE